MNTSEHYEFGSDKDGQFITFNVRISINVQGELQQRKVDVKTIKQCSHPSNHRCVVALCRDVFQTVEDFTESHFKEGINSLSKYLKSMCMEAKIKMDGRCFTNHSGKVTCATQQYQMGTFDEMTIMSRIGHRTTAVRSYKRPSSTLLKAVPVALQPPSGESEEPEGKI